MKRVFLGGVPHVGKPKIRVTQYHRQVYFGQETSATINQKKMRRALTDAKRKKVTLAPTPWDNRD